MTKKRGRPPKQTSSADVKTQAVEEVSTEVKVLPADEDKEYFFKSKFTADVVTLIKPLKIDHKDGSTTTNPGASASFEHNSWLTRNAHHAGLMRQIIQERPEIGIIETTP